MPYTKKDVETSKKNLYIKATADYDKIKKEIEESNLDITDKIILSDDKLRNPQSSGAFVEKLLIDFLKSKKISSQKGKGDALNKDGSVVEIKYGLFDGKGKSNIPQCRPYQNIDYYLIVKYDPIEDSFFISYSPSEVIKEICSTIECGSHGTKDSLENNTNVEKSIQISKNDRNKKPHDNLVSLSEYKFDSFDELNKHIGN